MLAATFEAATRSRRYCLILFSFAVFVLGVLPPARSLPAQSSQPAEYQVEAAYLYEFARFIRWPAQPSGDRPDYITLCALGKDPFGETLDDVLLGKTANGHPFSITRMHRIRELQGCQIVFIGSSERKRVGKVLDALQGEHVLTVGEADGLAEQGVTIQFVREGNQVRFTINLESAQRAGLKISSKLLSIAHVIHAGRPPGGG